MGRYRFVIGRLLQVVPLLFGITLVTFILLQLIPGDPALAMAGPRATPERIAEMRENLGLDEPIVVQYFEFLGNLVRLDLGDSIRLRLSVTEVIADRFVTTAWLLAGSVVLSLLIAIPLGTIAARHRDRTADHVVRAFSTFGLTLPTFWFGLILILIFGLRLGWFPTSGFGDSFTERVHAIFLPSLTLAIALAPVLIRSLRAAMIVVLESDYVAAARSTGFRGWRLTYHHVLRNASAAMIAILAVHLGFQLFAAVVVEATFALPGLGSTMITAVSQRDFPVIMGITIVFALVVVVVNLVADIVVALLDPRVEMS